jgi:hypothetical protein
MSMMRADFSARPPEEFLRSRRPESPLAGAQEDRSLTKGLGQFRGDLLDGRVEVLVGQVRDAWSSALAVHRRARLLVGLDPAVMPSP